MSQLKKIIQAIAEAGGIAYEVGGCVRDQLLGHANKDLDIEVFHLDAPMLSKILSRFGRVNEVGVSFGVIKLRTSKGDELDFTLPRRESKIGRGHRGFQVEVDHTLSVADAALRRDFTMNAIYRNLHDQTLIDPHGGVQDLEHRVLRATSEHFAEDPLRVLRGMQFAARFDATMSSDTIEMCRSLSHEYSSLALERVWNEWHKWATRSRRPSQGLMVLKQCGWIEHYPELAALDGVQQDPVWHPEGDVWVHTLHVCDAAATIADRESLSDDERILLMFSALCHDLGKPATTVLVDGRWRSPSHASVGKPLADSFLTRIGCPRHFIELVQPIVAEHLAHIQAEASPRTVRRLSVRLGKANIVQLMRLVEADLGGRPPLSATMPESLIRLMRIAETTNVSNSRPDRIILGRHLIALGYQPAPWFSSILERCYQAQLDGVFEVETDGIDFLKSELDARS
ncbi:MAG: HD domain-containing protein [Planctomycetota bacterium]|nr:HD domain-containing protein [Planctomycetota bacterium]